MEHRYLVQKVQMFQDGVRICRLRRVRNHTDHVRFDRRVLSIYGWEAENYSGEDYCLGIKILVFFFP